MMNTLEREHIDFLIYREGVEDEFIQQGKSSSDV